VDAGFNPTGLVKFDILLPDEPGGIEARVHGHEVREAAARVRRRRSQSPDSRPQLRPTTQRAYRYKLARAAADAHFAVRLMLSV